MKMKKSQNIMNSIEKIINTSKEDKNSSKSDSNYRINKSQSFSDSDEN